MKSTLEQLKLIDYLTTEIQIERRVFVEKLKGHVDHGNIGIIFSTFEAFSSSKNEYKGIVNFDSYKIRRRRKLFDMNISLAIAEGTFRENQGLLIIESTITGFHGVFIPFIVFILLFYIAFISVFIF